MLVAPPAPAAAQAAVQDSEGLAPAVDAVRLARIGAVVGDAIAAGQLPGAVVLVAHAGRTVYRQAFGLRAVSPVREPMTVDTIFDLASLTKAVATAPSVMALVEDGAIRLRDRVARHLPGFERHGKDAVTI